MIFLQNNVSNDVHILQLYVLCSSRIIAIALIKSTISQIHNLHQQK